MIISNNEIKKIIHHKLQCILPKTAGIVIHGTFASSKNKYISDIDLEVYLNVENDKTIEKNVSNTNNQSNSRIRQGQQNFRIKVLSAYSNRCCVTNSDLIESIEANHIEPYRNIDSNNINNGIPLRADIHKLWTQGLLCIDKNYKIILHDKAKNSLTYKDFNGIKIKIPINSNYHPNKISLQNWCNINSLSIEN